MLILRECHKLKLVQLFGFQKSPYERPTQKWVCGHLAAGKPCPIGPSRKGGCQATFECQPLQSESGVRWECTRPASRGGTCDHGPLPDGVCCKAITKCKPGLSVRAKRSRAVRWVASLAVGFIILLVSFSEDLNLLMPGPLNTTHASLKNCGDCHANVAGGNFGWLHAIFTPVDAVKDSTACLSCHKTGPQALNPHGLALDKLEAMTKQQVSVSHKDSLPVTAVFRNAMFPTKKTTENGVNCATCHKEHQGEQFNLKAMPDVQCQTCHVAQFSSFQNGHPKFSNYPYGRRTRIIFDHSSHFGTHFPKALKDGGSPKDQASVCADCHKVDTNKGLMLVKSYDSMCSTCHTGQIVGADRANGPKGITLLSLPGLDLEVLREKNADIGEWPEDSEAEISPMMKLLIGVDDKRRAMLEAVEKLDLLDLSEATDDDIALIVNFVWEVKSLVFQFSNAKPTDAMKMLNPKMGGSIDAKLLASLTANMPRDVMMGVQRDWLPNLSQEVLRHMRGEPMTPVVPAPKEEPVTEKSEADSSIETPTKAADGASDDILSGNDDDILAEKKDDDILSGNDDDILAEKKDDDILSGNDDDILAEKKDDDILSGNDDDILAEKKDDDGILSSDDDDILSGDTGKEETKTTEAEAKPDLPEPMDPEAWAEFGGWYRQDFAVLYKPTGHEDLFLHAWLDYTAKQYGNAKAALAAPIFDSLTDKQAQGQCAKCHSVDKSGEKNRKVNWKPFFVDESIGKFTKFSHEPHFGLFGDKGCLTCHTVNSEAKYRDTYKALDPKVFKSNFKPVEQQLCTDCHQNKAAGESCLLCHNYHVDDVVTPIMNTKVPKQ